MWKFHHPTEVVFGAGEAKNLGQALERLGFIPSLLSPGN